MSDKNLSYDEVLQMVKVFEASTEFSEFHLKYGDVEIDLRKHGAAPAPLRAAAVEAPGAAPAAAPVPAAPAPAAPREPAAKPAPAASAPSADAFPAGACKVTSPMVGTFYAAPEPGALPFVTVGQRVTPETTVCIIEVMKLMSSIRAEHAGVVTHVLVNDATPVEFGQTLIVIDPNA